MRGLRQKHLKRVNGDDVRFDKLGQTTICLELLCRAGHAEGKHGGHKDQQEGFRSMFHRPPPTAAFVRRFNSASWEIASSFCGSIFSARSSATRASSLRPSAFNAAPASTKRMARSEEH